MQFIHTSTRLSCDLGRAFRFLTIPSMIEKWSGLESEIDLKKGGNYTLNMEVACIRIHSEGSRIQAYEREKVLEISWKDTTQPDENYNLLIRFMPCRSDTEYCSELHLMFKHEDRALSRSESEMYGNVFEQMLEQIRQCQNKDWVIQDRDLTMSYLRGKGL